MSKKPTRNQLVPINHEYGEPAVDARDLHAFLQVGRDFTTWIRDRVEQYGFIENQDFIIFPDSGENSGRGRPKSQYLMTLGMAKELAMVERTDRGRQARRYFIECEKRLADEIHDPIPAARAVTRRSVAAIHGLAQTGVSWTLAEDICFYRSLYLSQPETSKLTGLSVHKIRRVEQALADHLGFRFPTVNVRARKSKIRDAVQALADRPAIRVMIEDAVRVYGVPVEEGA